MGAPATLPMLPAIRDWHRTARVASQLADLCEKQYDYLIFPSGHRIEKTALGQWVAFDSHGEVMGAFDNLIDAMGCIDDAVNGGGW